MALTPLKKKQLDELEWQKREMTQQRFFLRLWVALQSFYRSLVRPSRLLKAIKKIKPKKTFKRHFKKIESDFEEWESNALTPQTSHPQHPTLFHGFNLHLKKEMPPLKEYPFPIADTQKRVNENTEDSVLKTKNRL